MGCGEGSQLRESLLRSLLRSLPAAAVLNPFGALKFVQANFVHDLLVEH